MSIFIRIKAEYGDKGNGKEVEIAINEYVEVLEKIKERIAQAQYQVMTNLLKHYQEI